MQIENPTPKHIPQPNPTLTKEDRNEIHNNGRLFQQGFCYMRTGTVYLPRQNGWRRLTRKRTD